MGLYHLRPVDEASSHYVKMKAIGFEKGSGRNGIGSHFCFIFDSLIGVKIAGRRFYCSCLVLYQVISLVLYCRFLGGKGTPRMFLYSNA